MLSEGTLLPNELPSSGHIPMAIFDQNGYYIKGLKDCKIEGSSTLEVLLFK